jgi:hypothetical protein
MMLIGGLIGTAGVCCSRCRAGGASWDHDRHPPLLLARRRNDVEESVCRSAGAHGRLAEIRRPGSYM